MLGNQFIKYNKRMNQNNSIRLVDEEESEERDEKILSPQVIKIKKTQPTNYLQNNCWFLSPLQLSFELKKQILRCERLVEGYEEKQAKSFSRQGYENMLLSFRKAQLFIKFQPNPILGLYVYINLSKSNNISGTIYCELQFNKYTSISLNLTLRLLNDVCKKYPYQQMIPHNYLSADYKFYQNVQKKCYYHILKGRAYLALCLSKSKEGLHSQAFKEAQNAQNVLLQACHQMLVIYLNKLLKFLHNNKYLLRNRKFYKPTAMMNIQYQNYRLCINTLYFICKSQIKQISTKNSVKLSSLLKIIKEQMQTITSYSYYEFKQLGEGQQFIIDLQLKRNSFIEIVSMKLIDYQRIQNAKIKVQISEVHRIVTWLIASYYCLSAQAKYITKDPQIFQNEVTLSQHWLSRSLQLSSKILSQSVFFNQIKQLYKNLHAIKNQTIKEEEQEQASYHEVKKDVKFSTISPPWRSRVKKQKGGIQISTLKSKELDPIVIRKMKFDNAELSENTRFKLQDIGYRTMIRSLDTSSDKKKSKKVKMNLTYSKEKTINDVRKAYQACYNSPTERYKITKKDEEQLTQSMHQQNKVKQHSYYTKYKFNFKKGLYNYMYAMNQ